MLAMLKWLGIIALTLLLAAFSVANRHLVSLEFFPLPLVIEMPVYLLMLLLFFSGFLLAWSWSRLDHIQSALQIRSLKRRNQALEEDIARTKHHPLITGE